jgi:SPOR domain
MADNNFRPFRDRDPIAREDADPPYDAAQDPLAELARLIGQRDRGNESERGGPYQGAVATLDEAPAGDGQDWAADERYAEANPPEQHYAEDSYVQPRLAESYPAEGGYAGYARDDQRAPAPPPRYAEPAEQYDDVRDDDGAYDPRYRDDARDDESAHDAQYDAQYGDDPHDAQRSYAPRHRDDDGAPRSGGRQFPPLAPQSHDEHYEADDTDAAYDYDDDSESTPRRRGIVIILAMLGLILVGAASAYAYRAMFGGAILVPSLPPIIKPAGGPIKVVPNPATGAQNQSGAVNPGGPEKLVSREEQPVPVQPPPAPPQVISTIPVPQAPSAAPGAAPAPNVLAPAPPAAPSTTPAPPPRVAAPAQPGTASSTGTEPKKIHTVPIRGDQQGNGDAASAAPTQIVPGPAPTAAPAARPRSTEPVARPAPAPRGGANAPLSLVPGAQGAAAPAEPPPRSRVARGEPAGAPMATAPAAAPAPAPSAGGGYAVQVSSQRSEAEAQSAFKELQAKYPGQLGNRQAMIHRADLGAKGTYYRAMVGPFGSAEQAASLCSSIKAAGGSCIVQRN